MSNKITKTKLKRKNGMTIIEVVISFTIALILVMALYSIVYWGSTGFSDLNQKLIDIGNASIFIKTELTQNAGKYFYLEPIVGTEGQYILKMKAHTPNEIFGLINQNGYNRYNKIRTIRIKEPQRMNNTNLYKVEVEIEYEHKNIIRKNAFEIYLTANSFKVAPIGFNTIESINVGTFTVVSPTISGGGGGGDGGSGGSGGGDGGSGGSGGGDGGSGGSGGGDGGSGGSGGGGGGGCFELSSLILVKDYNNYKLKRIGDVKIGDIVLTIDPVENYKLKEIEVEKIHMHDEEEYEILEIITENSRLRLTPNHPLIIDENNTLKKAGKLEIGDKVLVYKNGNYTWQEIKEIKKEIIKDKVMTIELKDNINTFLVSSEENSFILAHSGYIHINLLKPLSFLILGGQIFMVLSFTGLNSYIFAAPPQKM